MVTSEPPNGDTPTGKARAFGRSLSDFPNRNDAEEELIAAAREGRVAWIGDEVPKDDDKDRAAKTIRAGLVRFLALGGDDATPVHERGVRVRGAIIDGELDFRSCKLVSDLFLWNCDLTDILLLFGARTRTVNLGGSNCRGIAADRLEAGGGVFLRDGFVAQGAVRLLGADIKGDLSCAGGRFEGRDEDGDALTCDGIQVGGSVFLSNGFVAEGAVRLLTATIKGHLNCIDGHFEGRDEVGNALHCDSIQVGGGVFLGDGFIAKGTVRLIGADIKVHLGCDGGQFEGKDEDGDALSCEHIRVGGNVFLRNGFAAQGAVNLLGAEIGGDVYCSGGMFGALPENPDGAQDESARQDAAPAEPIIRPLILARATVKGTLWLGHSSVAASFHGGVDLTGASINRIVDMVTARSLRRVPDATPAGGSENPCFLLLDGLTYARFGESTNLGAPARIAFLKLQREYDLGRAFKPQPWTQMVKTLREMGHTDAARAVAIEYEEMRREAGTITSLSARLLHWLYGFAVGYGHRPMRLARIMVAVALICSAIFDTAAGFGVMAPSSPVVYENSAYAACRPENGGNWTTCKSPYEYTVFNSWIYSLDLILPLVDLQQEREWAPMVMRPCAAFSFLGVCWNPQEAMAGDRPVTAHTWPLGFVVWVFMWFEILFGWAASLLFVSVAAGFIKRMDSE